MAASKWPPYSPLPHVAPDGTVSEPLSGRFSVICRPEEGEEGIQRAILDCEEGGSILLREGVYHVTRALRLNRIVHIFGRGRAELRLISTIGFAFVECSSPSATLDRLRIDNPTKRGSHTLHITSGHLRLQCCDVSSKVGNKVGNGCFILCAFGPSTVADALGCSSAAWKE